MPRGRRFRRAGFSRRAPRRVKEWATHESAVSLVGGTPFVQDLLVDYQAVKGADANGVTVARIIGKLYFNKAAGGVSSPTVGIKVGGTGEDADDVNPISFHYLDWMYWDKVRILRDQTQQVDIKPGGELVVDIRSQRRIHELQNTLQLCAAMSAGDATTSMDWHFRILLLQP